MCFMRPSVVLFAIILLIYANRPVPTVAWSRCATTMALEASRINFIALHWSIQGPGCGFKRETAGIGIVILVMATDAT